MERYAAIGDTLDIVCPFFDENSDELTEQSIIYRVTEEEYENCERRSKAKELGRCTQPYQEEKLKVAFRLMSPNPSGLDYRPGVTYYFICEFMEFLILNISQKKIFFKFLEQNINFEKFKHILNIFWIETLISNKNCSFKSYTKEEQEFSGKKSRLP